MRAARAAEEEERSEALYSGRRYGGLDGAAITGTGPDERPYDVRCFFLCPNDRMKHAAAIDERCETMLSGGLLRETADLRLSGHLPDGGQPARAIGYRQALDYLQRDGPKEAEGGDRASLNSFMADFASATRRYAKKQMQWFRRDPDFLFVPVDLSASAEDRVGAAADAVLNLCLLPREEYERELAGPDGDDDDEDRARGAVGDENLPLSWRTKVENERQGKGMKFFRAQRRSIVEGTDLYESILEEADSCAARLRGGGVGELPPL